jgi:hypothetical protein
VSDRASTPDAALRLLTPGPGRLLFLVEDDVFAQSRVHPPLRVGRLSDHLRALALAGPLLSEPCAGVVGVARSYATQLSELQFVLGELLPLLRSFDPARSRAASSPPDLCRDFRELEECTSDLQNALEGKDAGPDTSALALKNRAALTQLLRLPCALAGTAVIPLAPVRRSRRGEIQVVVDGQRYRYRLDATRPVANFLQALNRAAEWSFSRAIVEDPILQRRAADLLNLVRSILSACGASGPELRFAISQGSRLELLHSGGFWVLVYGPARNRVRDHTPFFVGLAIRGTTRRERLAMAPGISPTTDGFFTPNGEPKRGGICLGSQEQYRRLQSAFFTDAEAFLYWLDASVIVATHRSAFHHQWRAEHPRKRARRRPIQPRR